MEESFSSLIKVKKASKSIRPSSKQNPSRQQFSLYFPQLLPNFEKASFTTISVPIKVIPIFLKKASPFPSLSKSKFTSLRIHGSPLSLRLKFSSPQPHKKPYIAKVPKVKLDQFL